ncbi:unnamed protein product [Bursaphelenchus okinawaensis]|uniref:Uncharacterized protein n=1 Tax=Bursaphelenchus okinawaensis TaxID=465554 RepID=A0A811K165_9BILA|nr:unnamed protein product [Bursaphelenchus okinawaensis]CAG9088806.1 unnamed protein product [Bursaphelenchus okinawaensis]
MWLPSAILFGLSFSALFEVVKPEDGRKLAVTCPSYSTVSHDGERCLLQSEGKDCTDSIILKTEQRTGMIVFRENDDVPDYLNQMAAIHVHCGLKPDLQFALVYHTQKSFVDCGGGARQTSRPNNYKSLCYINRYLPFHKNLKIAEYKHGDFNSYVTYEEGKGNLGVFPYSKDVYEKVGGSNGKIRTGIERATDLIHLYSTNGYGVSSEHFKSYASVYCTFNKQCVGEGTEVQETARLN